MRKLALTAYAGLLLALPGTANAQANAHPQGEDQAQHDHSAPPAGDTRPDAAPMPRPQMEMGKHMEDCRCPCCEIMQRRADSPSRQQGDAPEAAPEQHDHQQ